MLCQILTVFLLNSRVLRLLKLSRTWKPQSIRNAFGALTQTAMKLLYTQAQTQRQQSLSILWCCVCLSAAYVWNEEREDRHCFAELALLWRNLSPSPALALRTNAPFLIVYFRYLFVKCVIIILYIDFNSFCGSHVFHRRISTHTNKRRHFIVESRIARSAAEQYSNNWLNGKWAECANTANIVHRTIALTIL